MASRRTWGGGREDGCGDGGGCSGVDGSSDYGEFWGGVGRAVTVTAVAMAAAMAAAGSAAFRAGAAAEGLVAATPPCVAENRMRRREQHACPGTLDACNSPDVEAVSHRRPVDRLRASTGLPELLAEGTFISMDVRARGLPVQVDQTTFRLDADLPAILGVEQCTFLQGLTRRA